VFSHSLDPKRSVDTPGDQIDAGSPMFAPLGTRGLCSGKSNAVTVRASRVPAWRRCLAHASAAAIAESLRDAVAKLAIEHRVSDKGKVPISIGAASWQGMVAESVTSIVKAGDEALYRAKAIGRNRVSGTILG
jgi:GGDEF domain-containing protein